jgi:hypothetical protein
MRVGIAAGACRGGVAKGWRSCAGGGREGRRFPSSGTWPPPARFSCGAAEKGSRRLPFLKCEHRIFWRLITFLWATKSCP